MGAVVVVQADVERGVDGRSFLGGGVLQSFGDSTQLGGDGFDLGAGEGGRAGGGGHPDGQGVALGGSL